MLGKYASDAFARLVSRILDSVQISATPINDLTKEDLLGYMTAELKHSLEKPSSERHWVMVID